ncbi:MAG: hypothetical protein ACYCQK_01990 [Acidiferrobacteraceae bacterium]
MMREGDVSALTDADIARECLTAAMRSAQNATEAMNALPTPATPATGAGAVLYELCECVGQLAVAVEAVLGVAGGKA